MDTSPIIIGCDHAAVALKNNIRDFIKTLDIEVTDIGANSFESVHYPDFGKKVASTIANGDFSRGILLCGTGLGMSMVANRFPGIRAALCNDLFSAILSRQHNNANILVMGGRMIGDILAQEIVKAWLETPFEGGRHQLRLDMIDNQ